MTDELKELKKYIGLSDTDEDLVVASTIAKLAATIGVDNPAPEVGDPLPPGWHAPFFGTATPRGELRDDGSPTSSGISVPIPLPKRRLTGDTMEFHAPLHVGERITRRAEIADIRVEEAPDGPVIHTLLRHTINNESGPAIIEERAFFYLGETAAGPKAATQRPPAKADWERKVDPDPVLMFRFSALRFNGHRVHYDRDYAMGVEDCPGLLVPGGMISFMLLDLCREKLPDRTVTEFGYRTVRPVYDTGPFTLAGTVVAKGNGVALWANGPDGKLAMTASVRLESEI
jgi:3-methylfumaryl-CoA hydratase